MQRLSIWIFFVFLFLIPKLGHTAPLCTHDITLGVIPSGGGDCSTICEDQTGCSLESAIFAAGHMVSIQGFNTTLNLAGGEYTLSTPLEFNPIISGGNLTIQKDSSASSEPVLNGQGTMQILSIQTKKDVTISGITFENGNSNGGDANGLYIASQLGADSFTVKITSCNFESNISSDLDHGQGGGLGVKGNANITIDLEKNIFHNNSSGDAGGFVADVHGNITLKGNTFTENSATSTGEGTGGAFSISGAFITIGGDSPEEGNILDTNTATGRAGGADITSNTFGDLSSGIIFKNNQVLNNTAHEGRGGVSINAGSDSQSSPSNVDVSNNVIQGNHGGSGTKLGGGIEINHDSESGTFNFNANLISNNTVGGAGGGAAITLNMPLVPTETPVISNNIIVNNQADLSFSGLFLSIEKNTTLSIINNTIANNNPGQGVGGLGVIFEDLTDSATLNLYNNIIFGNTNTGENESDVMLLQMTSGDRTASYAANIFNNDYSSICFGTINMSFQTTLTGCDPTQQSGVTTGNNINQDPLFTQTGGDINAADYYNLSTAPLSPAIATGTYTNQSGDTLTGVAIDYNGSSRPVSSPDMGALEHVSVLITLNVSGINFPNFVAGGSNTQSVTLTNSGSQDAPINSITSDSSNFTVGFDTSASLSKLRHTQSTSACPSSNFTLPAGQSCSLDRKSTRLNSSH